MEVVELAIWQKIQEAGAIAIPPILFRIAAACLIHSIVTTRVSVKALVCPLYTAENERKPYSFGPLKTVISHSIRCTLHRIRKTGLGKRV